jgi:uncharacterized membrane protein YphA (DoxX/SURF4 family)
MASSRKPPPTFHPKPVDPSDLATANLRDLEDPTHGFPIRALSSRKKRDLTDEELDEVGLPPPIDNDVEEPDDRITDPRRRPVVDARVVALWLLVFSGLVVLGVLALAAAVVYL